MSTLMTIKVPKGYRVILLDARQKRSRQGKRTTWARAKYFHLCYHSRQIGEYIRFTDRRRSVKSKQAYFALLANKAEAYLAPIRQERARKARETRYKNKLEAILKAERISLKNLRFEESKTGQNKRHKDMRPPAVIGPVAITPILTKATDYTKEIVQKKVRSVMWSQYTTLQILDFTLKEPIEVTPRNLKTVVTEVEHIFQPHIQKYFKQSRGTPRTFWFRLKFSYLSPDKETGEIKIRHSGMSIDRFQVNDLLSGPTKLKAHVSEKVAEERFWPEIEKTYTTAEEYILKNNYFDRAIDKKLMITGFTLENVIELGHRFDPEKIQAAYLKRLEKRKKLEKARLKKLKQKSRR